MLFLKQSTASQAVLIGPFVDSANGNTVEDGLTIDAADIRLSKNGANIVGKNSGGGTHDELGYYTITLDATDTNTVGRLQVMVHESGALPVYHEFWVLEEAIFDALFGASATGLLPANVTQFGGSNGTFASGRPEVNTTHAAGTAWGSGAITAGSIAGDAITNAKIADNAIAAENIASNAITDAKIATGAFTSAKFAAGAFDAVWSVATRLLTAGTNIVLAKGTGVTGFTDLSAAQVNAEVDTALSDIHLDHLLAATYDPSSKPGAADALLNELVENDGGVARFTANALEEAPTGGSAPSASEIVDEMESQMQADPTGFHVNVLEWAGNVVTASGGNPDVNVESMDDDVITAGKFDQSTAHPLASADSGSTAVARVGAGGDTLETLSDEIAAVKGDTAATLVDTNELQTDWTDGGRLDLLLDAIKVVTDALTSPSTIATAVWASATRLLTAGTNIVLAKGTGVTGFNDLSAAQVNTEVDTALADYDPPTKAELDSAVSPLATSAEVGALNDLSAAEVNAEVVDALNTDTYAEPGQGAPGATVSLTTKIGFLYKAWRNRSTQTASEYALYADDGTTKDQEAAVTDDGTTTTKGEMGTGA